MILVMAYHHVYKYSANYKNCQMHNDASLL